jgi:hypothetical protein
MRRIAVLAVLFLVPACFGDDETLTVSGGTSVLADNGVTGAVWQVTGAQVTVRTTETVSTGVTATVTYQVGPVVGGNFMVMATYTRNLTAGANQAVSNTFTALPQSTELTVKMKTTYSDSTINTHGLQWAAHRARRSKCPAERQ